MLVPVFDFVVATISVMYVAAGVASTEKSLLHGVVLSTVTEDHFFENIPNSLGASCTDPSPIQCWLGAMVIPLPDFEADGFIFTNLELYNLGITGIDSSYTIDEPISIYFAPEGMTAKVSGKYKKNFLSGDMTAAVSQMTFDVNLLVNSSRSGDLGQFQVPSGLSFTACEFKSIKVKVSLNLGLDHPIVDLALQNEIKKIFCNELGDVLATNVTDSMQSRLDPFLVHVMENQPDSVPLSYENSNFINWSKHIFGPLHTILESLGASQFMQCFLDDHAQITSPSTASIINYFIDIATNGTGEILIDINRTSTALDPVGGVIRLGDNVTMELQSALFSGLDSLSNMQLFMPQSSSSSKTGLVSSITLDCLNMNFSSVTFVNGHTDDSTLYHYNESTIWDVTLSNITLSFELDVAVNGTFLTMLYMDQLTNPACLLDSLNNVTMSSLIFDVSVEDVIMHQEHGEAATLEMDTVMLMNNVYSLLTGGFETFVTEMIAGVVQGWVRVALNVYLQSLLHTARESFGTCPIHTSHQDQSEYIVWGQSAFIKDVNALISPVLINRAVNCLTNDSGTTLPLILPLRNTTTISSEYNLELELGGLNSWYLLNLLLPTVNDDFSLHSEIGLGVCTTSNDASCMSPFTFILGKGLTSGQLTSGRGYVETAISNLSVSSSSLIKMNRDTLYDLRVGQVVVKGCMLSTIDIFSITSLIVELDDIAVIFVNQDGQNKTQDLTYMVSTHLSTLFDKLVPKINDYVSTQLQLASETCADGGVTPSSGGQASVKISEKMDWKWQIGLISLGSFLVLVLFIFHHRYLDQQKEAIDSGSLVNEANEINGVDENRKHFFSSAIVCDRRIPFIFRVLFPLTIVGTFTLFVWSNSSPDPVSVHAYVYIEGVALAEINVFSFSLADTVKDMWEAKVYLLATLIAFFSGGWPYVKLAVMMFSFFSPCSLFPVTLRDDSLKLVDAYGKWSLIDFFVMCMFLCAFYFDLRLGPPTSSGDGSAIEVVLRVVPTFGFYSFLLATLVSLGQGHIMIALHRFVAFDAEQPPLHKFETKKNISNHSFTVKMTPYLLDLLVKEGGDLHSSDNEIDSIAQNGRGNGSENALHGHEEVTVSATRGGIIVLIIAYILAFLFICVGVYVHSFNFEFLGLTGYLLGDSAESGYSVLSIASDMVADSGLSDDISMRWMQACFLSTCVAMPLVCILTIVFLWVGPRITIDMQKSVFLLAEITNAWCALDVLCASIVACILEIRQFAAFMVGDACDGLNEILAEYMDTALHGEDVCFDVKTTLTPQVYLLFVAVFIVCVANNLSLWLIERCISERVKEEVQDGQSRDAKVLAAEEDIHITSPLHSTSAGFDLRKPLLSTRVERSSIKRSFRADEVAGVVKTDQQDEEAYSMSSNQCQRFVRCCVDAVAWKLLALLWRFRAVIITRSKSSVT